MLVNENISIIEQLDEALYPELNRLFRRTSLRKHLLGVLSFFACHPYGIEQNSKGEMYWAVSISYLVSKYGGSPTAWQGHIIFLVDAGLLKRIKPDERSLLPEMKRAYKNSLKEKKQPPSFYQIVSYTPGILAHAESIAEKYHDAGLCISHLTKEDVIRLNGQHEANCIYRDGRRIGKDDMWAWALIKKRMLRQIEKNGFTTPEKIRPHGNTPGRREAIFKAMKRKKAICLEAGCRYHSPTKAEKEKFHLKNSNWIITK